MHVLHRRSAGSDKTSLGRAQRCCPLTGRALLFALNFARAAPASPPDDGDQACPEEQWRVEERAEYARARGIPEQRRDQGKAEEQRRRGEHGGCPVAASGDPKTCKREHERRQQEDRCRRPLGFVCHGGVDLPGESPLPYKSSCCTSEGLTPGGSLSRRAASIFRRSIA